MNAPQKPGLAQLDFFQKMAQSPSARRVTERLKAAHAAIAELEQDGAQGCRQPAPEGRAMSKRGPSQEYVRAVLEGLLGEPPEYRKELLDKLDEKQWPGWRAAFEREIERQQAEAAR